MIEFVPGMTLLQAVQRQVKMKEAPISASVGFRMIRADLEEDSDVEMARPAVTDPVKDVMTRATKQTAQNQTEGSKTCRQQVQQAETERQRVASETQAGRQRVAQKAQMKQEQAERQRVAQEEIG